MGAAVAAPEQGSARGRVLLMALAIVPWLGLFVARSGQGALGALGHALALAAALHGAGALVAWAAGERGSAWLRVSWGAAAMIAVGGAMMLLGRYGASGQSSLLFLGVIAHSVELARGASEHAVALGEVRGWRWPLLIFAVTAVAALHVLGSAAALAGSAWDGEAHVLGQLRLLADTGHLGDAVGFARSQSLGGGLVLRALAGLSWAPTVDSLGLAALLALAAGRALGARGGRDGALWAGLVVLAGMTFSRWPADAALYWWPAALLLAAALSVEERAALPSPSPRRAIPLVLLAAALAVLHHALVPAALALLGVALWPHRRRRAAWALVALGLAALAPYLVERATARGALPALALSLGLPRAGFSPLRLAAAAAVTAALAPLVRCLVADRGVAVVLAAALAAACAPFPATRPHAGAYALVGALALVAFAAARLARLAAAAETSVAEVVSASSAEVASASSAESALASSAEAALPRSSPSSWSLAAAMLSLLLLVSLYEAQERGGGQRWSYRWTALSSAAGYLAAGPVAPPSTASAALLSIPDGATVALWLGQPEHLSHRRHRLLDVRTPFFAALLDRSPERFLRALLAARPSHLLYAPPLLDRSTHRSIWRSIWRPLWLAKPCPRCSDPFAEILAPYRTVWEGEGLRLVSFAPP